MKLSRFLAVIRLNLLSAIVTYLLMLLLGDERIHILLLLTEQLVVLGLWLWLGHIWLTERRIVLQKLRILRVTHKTLRLRHLVVNILLDLLLIEISFEWRVVSIILIEVLVV